jgi:hypothetical protein
VAASKLAFFVTLALIVGGTLYIRLRWRRSPQAYRTMIAMAVCYFVAGSLFGAWALHLAGPKPQVATLGAGTSIPAAAAAAAFVATPAAQPANLLNKFSAKVASILDGDTIDVLGPDNAPNRIRLEGIDAPEHEQAFGMQSKCCDPPAAQKGLGSLWIKLDQRT